MKLFVKKLNEKEFNMEDKEAVSYTHLDVYKRQLQEEEEESRLSTRF